MFANKPTVWLDRGALAMRAFSYTLALGSPLGARASRPRLRRWLTAALLLTTAAVYASEPEGLRGPDVTIIAGEERTVYEYRQNGHLRMVKIVPNWGKPYYLFPRDQTAGFGDLEEADMLLPTWVIVEF